MSTIKTTAGALALASTLAACAIPMAPGADKVRVTSVPADVQACKAVGNVRTQPGPLYEDELRNQTVGDGGDTLLMLVGATGIAYRCAQG